LKGPTPQTPPPFQFSPSKNGNGGPPAPGEPGESARPQWGRACQAYASRDRRYGNAVDQVTGT